MLDEPLQSSAGVLFLLALSFRFLVSFFILSPPAHAHPSCSQQKHLLRLHVLFLVSIFTLSLRPRMPIMLATTRTNIDFCSPSLSVSVLLLCALPRIPSLLPETTNINCKPSHFPFRAIAVALGKPSVPLYASDDFQCTASSVKTAVDAGDCSCLSRSCWPGWCQLQFLICGNLCFAFAHADQQTPCRCFH